MRAFASSAWPSSAGDGPRYHKGAGGGEASLVVHQTSRWPVRAYYVTTLTVNIYQAGRPPPTRQRIVTLGWLSVEQKSRPKRSGRGASGMDRRGGPGGGERERGPFKNTKVDHSATLLESIRGGEDTPLLPTRMEISFFFLLLSRIEHRTIVLFF